MSKITFQLVTPERSLLNEEIDSLTCPTVDGQITVLPKHEPLVAPLQHGELVVRQEGETKHIAISGGFVEVRSDNSVVILADSAEHAHEINVERAEEAKRRAEEAMKSARHLNEKERAVIVSTYNKNVARLHVAQRAAHRSKKHMSDSGILKK